MTNQFDTQPKSTSSHPKDENRITRMINNLDQQDLTLNPEKRKRKWFFVLAGLFLLYLVSFLFPLPELSHHSLGTAKANLSADTVMNKTLNNQKSMTFEMPVDSFENLLKKSIHAKLPEKE